MIIRDEGDATIHYHYHHCGFSNFDLDLARSLLETMAKLAERGNGRKVGRLVAMMVVVTTKPHRYHE